VVVRRTERWEDVEYFVMDKSFVVIDNHWTDTVEMLD
jgi:hypothetical protein